MAPGLNIILFGETGCGKSSIVNMIAEQELAPMSNGAAGCTFRSVPYQVDIMGMSYTIYDTAGLDEGESGNVPKEEAIIQLYKLLCSLKDGVSLLIFCMRGPRIKDAVYKNWRLFHEIICQKQVPIAIAITGLEDEDSMDEWWYKNKGVFQGYGMNPCGIACITATRGKKKSGVYRLSEEYEESKKKVWKLIRAHHLEKSWNMEKIEWFSDIVITSYTSDWCRRIKEHREVHREEGAVINELVRRCGMSPAEASTFGKNFATAQALML